jgi:hypothetical protein
VADNEALSFLTGSSRDKPVRKHLVETAQYIQAGVGLFQKRPFLISHFTCRLEDV